MAFFDENYRVDASNASAKLAGSGIFLQRKTLTTRKNFMG
jgi:hypothetical protein